MPPLQDALAQQLGGLKEQSQIEKDSLNATLNMLRQQLSDLELEKRKLEDVRDPMCEKQPSSWCFRRILSVPGMMPMHNFNDRWSSKRLRSAA